MTWGYPSSKGEPPQLTLANPTNNVKSPRACAELVRRHWRDFFASVLPAILLVSHEKKITAAQISEEKNLCGEDDRARRVAYALWPLHDLRLFRPQPTGRSCRAGPWQPSRPLWKGGCASRSCAFPVPDWRRPDFAALRLPRSTRAFTAEDWPSALGCAALSAAGRPRHRTDEQASRLPAPGRWDGHGRSQRKSWLCRGRARLRLLRADSQAARRKKDPPALQ